MSGEPGARDLTAQLGQVGRTGDSGRRADRLDHLVVNALFKMDAAAALFSALGFQLTPRGHHSLGSINHLMMLPGCYLELVGLPLGTDRLRQEVLDSPLGASGFVGASDDIEATRQRLSSHGFEPLAIKDFSRPVLLDGVAQDARFRTVAVAPSAFAADRVYWCQHLTPELVWRDAWLVHDNGLMAIEHLVVQSTNAERTAQRLAQATGADPIRQSAGWQITLSDGFSLRVEAGARDRFAGIGLAFGDLSLLANRAAGRDDVGWTALESGSARLTVPSLDLELHCRQQTL